jgi:hypothetical protein
LQNDFINNLPNQLFSKPTHLKVTQQKSSNGTTVTGETIIKTSEKSPTPIVDRIKTPPEQERKGYLKVRFNGEPCYGAAHGTVGTCYMLLKATQVVEELRNEPELMQALQETVKRICTIIETQDGHLPVSKDQACNMNCFCNGSAGAIPLLCMAIECFPEMHDQLLKVALLAGERVWEQGMLLRHRGLN